MSDLCVQCLMQMHRRIEKSSTDLQALLDAPKSIPSSPPAAERVFSVTGRFVSLVNGFLRAKEEVLFPALDSFLSSETGPLAVLRSEHANLRALIASMRKHAKSFSRGDGGAAAWEQYRKDGQGALSILRNQIYKEERVFFPMVARLLTSEQDAILAERIAQIDGDRRPRLTAKALRAARNIVSEGNAYVPEAQAQIGLSTSPSGEPSS